VEKQYFSSKLRTSLAKITMRKQFFLIMERLILSGGLMADNEICFNQYCHASGLSSNDHSRCYDGKWIQRGQTCSGSILTLAGIKQMGLA
jgi:hypothetical protein